MAKKNRGLFDQLGKILTPLSEGYALSRGVPAELLPSYQSRIDQRRRQDLRMREKFAKKSEDRAVQRQIDAEQRALDMIPLQYEAQTKAELDSQKQRLQRLEEDSEKLRKRRLGGKDRRPVSQPTLSPADSVSLSAAPQSSMRPDAGEVPFNPLRDEEAESQLQELAEAAASPFSFLGTDPYPVMDEKSARKMSDDPQVVRAGLSEQSRMYRGMMDTLAPDGRGKAAERMKIIEQAKQARPAAAKELMDQLMILEEEDPIEQYTIKTPTVQELVEGGDAFTNESGTFVRNGNISFNPTLTNTRLKSDSAIRQTEMQLESKERIAESQSKEQRREKKNEQRRQAIEDLGGKEQFYSAIRKQIASEYGITDLSAIDHRIVVDRMKQEADKYSKAMSGFGFETDDEIEELNPMQRLTLTNSIVNTLLNAGIDQNDSRFLESFKKLEDYLTGKVKEYPVFSDAASVFAPSFSFDAESLSSIPVDDEQAKQYSSEDASIAENRLRSMGIPVTDESKNQMVAVSKSTGNNLLSRAKIVESDEFNKFMQRVSSEHKSIKDDNTKAIPMPLIQMLANAQGISFEDAALQYASQSNAASGMGVDHLSQFSPQSMSNMLNGSVAIVAGDQESQNEILESVRPGELYILMDGTIMRKPKESAPSSDLVDKLSSNPAFESIMNLLGNVTGEEYTRARTIGKKKSDKDGGGGYPYLDTTYEAQQ